MQDVAQDHVRAIHESYGTTRGLGIARKHVGWYLQHIPALADQRSVFNRLDSTEAQLDCLQNYYGQYQEQAA